jgi:hypothetical protein
MKNWILVLFVAGAAGLLAALATARPDAGRAVGAVQLDAASELTAIRRSVDDLVAVLGRIERRLEDAPAPLARSEARAPDELAAALRELCARLDQGALAAPARRGPVAPGVGTAWARPSETLWPALDQLADLWAYDPEAARREVFFLETEELLARFGPPQSVRADDGGELRWSYGVGDPARSVRPYKVLVTLHGGRVTGLRVLQG